MLWTEARRAVALAVSSPEAVWGRGAVGDRLFPAWSAARSSFGKLVLCMDTPRETCWSPRSRTDKTTRAQRAQNLAAQRRIQIFSQCARVCFWYDVDTQTWTSGPGLAADVGGDAHRRRLLGETKCFFAIVALRGRDDGIFAAQSLSHPVAARARSAKEAINGLRTALARWTRGGTAFPSAEPQERGQSYAPFSRH